jgi:ABC-type multidrug transport system ATPase subunit
MKNVHESMFMNVCSRRNGGCPMELEVCELTRVFGRVTAVRDMSFTAPAGQVTGLLGPNGSGKTTTLRDVT